MSKYLTSAHQTAARTGAHKKANKVAVFDILNVQKYHVDIDDVRCPGDGVSMDYALNEYVDQYRDPTLFRKGYFGE